MLLVWSTYVMVLSLFSTAESIQLCYTSHFVIIVVVVGSSSDIGIDVVNNCVILSHDICGFFCKVPCLIIQ